MEANQFYSVRLILISSFHASVCFHLLPVATHAGVLLSAEIQQEYAGNKASQH